MCPQLIVYCKNAGSVANLGCSISGTSDVGLLLRMCLEVGLASDGITWVWDVKAMLSEAARHSAAASAAPGMQGLEPGQVTTAAYGAGNRLGDVIGQSSQSPGTIIKMAVPGKVGIAF